MKHNPENERVKHRYLAYLKEARQQSEGSVDTAANALSRWEEYTNGRGFASFHYQQAVAFKNRLTEQRATRSGERLSKATVHGTLRQLRQFFQWLSMQSGFKSKIDYCDADYFNLSAKEARVATARREKPWPTVEQIKHVLTTMPTESEVALRNRALVAFAILTGMRDRAIASIKMKHVDLIGGYVDQDAREVRTKFSKTFRSYFFPVGQDVVDIVVDWVKYLRETKLWGNNDPLFPKTHVASGDKLYFEAFGLEKSHWSTASTIRTIFREAFNKAGLAYFNPHSFRTTLTRLGEAICKTPEEFKAWSQNLGHEKVLTTFTNYGEIEVHRQGEIIHGLRQSKFAAKEGLAAVAHRLHSVIDAELSASSFRQSERVDRTFSTPIGNRS